MQRITKTSAVFGALIVASGVMIVFANATVAASAGPSIRSLPDKGTVTVSGTVDKVWDDHDFTLRDNSGNIDVKLASDQSALLKQGDNVTVTGTVEKPLWGLLGKDISAGSVQVDKDIGTVLSDAVTTITGISMDKAQVVQIGKLPREGEVRITGVVDKIGNDENFTVKDATGAVNVRARSSDSTVVAKGSEVTVTGFVKSSIFGKKIDATHVITLSDVAPAAGPAAGPMADSK